MRPFGPRRHFLVCDQKEEVKMIKSMSLAKKLAMLITFFLLLLAMTSAYSVYEMRGIGFELVEIAEEDLPLIRTLTNTTMHTLEQAVHVERMVRFGEEAHGRIEANAGAQALLDKERAQFDQLNAKVLGEVQQGINMLKSLQSNAQTEDARKEFEKIASRLDKVQSLHKEYSKAVLLSLKLIDEGKIEEATEIALKAGETGDEMDGILEELTGDIEKFTLASAIHAEKREQRALLIILSLAGLTLVAGILLGVFITRSITRPLADNATRMSQAFSETGVAAVQLSEGSQTLASAASEQAATLEQTSSSMEEITSMVSATADRTSEVEMVMEEVRQTVEKGGAAIGRLITAMSLIKSSSDETAKIIKTIDEIAFQTNLLALNAAVEAARAGDAGRGFAVVAEEVRNLAQRSAVAAKETSNLIQGALENSQQGVEVTGEVEQVLKDISESIATVSDLAGQVAQASKEQSRGVEQVSEGVTQMDQITQANAASAEETAASSEELSSQVINMERMLEELNQLIFARSFHDSNGGTAKHITSDNGSWSTDYQQVNTTQYLSDGSDFKAFDEDPNKDDNL